MPSPIITSHSRPPTRVTHQNGTMTKIPCQNEDAMQKRKDTIDHQGYLLMPRHIFHGEGAAVTLSTVRHSLNLDEVRGPLLH